MVVKKIDCNVFERVKDVKTKMTNCFLLFVAHFVPLYYQLYSPFPNFTFPFFFICSFLLFFSFISFPFFSSASSFNVQETFNIDETAMNKSFLPNFLIQFYSSTDGRGRKARPNAMSSIFNLNLDEFFWFFSFPFFFGENCGTKINGSQMN